MVKVVPRTPEEIAKAQKAAWHKELRRTAWARSPNWLHSLAFLGYMAIWIGLCWGTIALLGANGMLPMQGYAPLYMMLAYGLLVGILAFFFFRRIDNFIERRFEKELRKVFEQFDEPYPYEGEKLR